MIDEETPTTNQRARPQERLSPQELAQRGGIIAALVVLVVAMFVTFFSVGDALNAWLVYRYVALWNAMFALSVAGLAVWVILRLTRART